MAFCTSSAGFDRVVGWKISILNRAIAISRTVERKYSYSVLIIDI